MRTIVNQWLCCLVWLFLQVCLVSSQTQEELLAELERVKSELSKLQQKDQAAANQAAEANAQLGRGSRGSYPSSSGLPSLNLGSGEVLRDTPPATAVAGGGFASLSTYPELGSRGASSIGDVGRSSDGCFSHPLFAALHSALQKLALLEQDPVEAAFQIHEAWEIDAKLFDVCPVGLITALVYLSIAQERDWKYSLLHRATYLLYSTPGLAEKMYRSRWPMSDRLIRTMYHNSEVAGRSPLKFGQPEAQPGPVAFGQSQDLQETTHFSMMHSNSELVHFKTILFYHFYHQEGSCSCRTRSWCLPYWLRHVTNKTVDIWLAARDERKSLFRMDSRGCFRSLGIGLGSHHFAEAFDAVFVFEINALMHPQCRILPARRLLLYPTFDLSDEQMDNFEQLGVSVLPDDGLLKPPNPKLKAALEEAYAARVSRASPSKPKDRLLVFPADIRPMKGQAEFLRGVLFGQASTHRSAQQLKGITIVLAGSCDGNQSYCEEVVQLSQQVNNEGILVTIIADMLKDDELAQLYAAALGVVLYSRIDCNPRAVYEGLVTDTPFFVTETTKLPASIQHLGHIVAGDPANLASELADFIQFAEGGGFTGRGIEFARKHLDEFTVYRRVVQWADMKYLRGRLLDPVMKNEEALAGALAGSAGAGVGAGGGLAALLGGLAQAGGKGGAGGLDGLAAAGQNLGAGQDGLGGLGSMLAGLGR
mmetsp:Transcript_90567/g.198487  ORF Transcript_90567/g.198487 Transcript_90567/m.198487 type:complete len:705 (+) Transcript_90567:122-2236(+)|eukprot:CAMPEP_0206546770 /NCGR_PEP_ID=MMETSP0325_2-20121206/12917_1 /ASSEMBLY_ACC=CAM_ASM_000347 /TAXON_ID=2866 /ORGANISM="Crypthecodinium cohnii, Strain Seligo" /LENGTH=704 /DNA_ID=CAMNT_0054045985 /DNA_START=52 /DNA_END=2166 /DNA_ORIENTATION=-